MRGQRNPQSTMFAFVNLEERVHRTIHSGSSSVCQTTSLTACQTTSIGCTRRSVVPRCLPERLLKALLLISLYSIRSERAFCQELDYNLLYRWFLDMDLMEPSFDATVFTKNRRRLLRHRVGRKLFEEVAYEADCRGLMSDEHFSVDGTLIEAAASIKSFRRRDEDDESKGEGEGPSGDFRGEKLSNTTHRSTTDPDARLMRKGKGRELNITPHVARKKRWSAIDGRTTRHEAYRSSQKVRKRVESIFGWMKAVGGSRRSRYVGLERTGTVWGVGCDGLQPCEDVEVDTRAGD